MRNISPADQDNIIQFPLQYRNEDCLTKRDKKDVADFRAQAQRAGFDALMIHIASDHVGGGTRDYVAAYRNGEAWSSWGFARHDGIICSWNALTSKDTGVFPTMQEALGHILAASSRQASMTPAKKQSHIS